jgi:Na+/H+-dicarboxylate symporter
MHISKLMNSQPSRLVLAIIAAFFLNNIMPLELKQLFLSISLSMKELLMFMIPLIIFSSVYTAFSKIRGNAIFFVVLLLGTIVLSNFASVSIAGIFSYLMLSPNTTSIHNPHEIIELAPLWKFAIPKLLSNNLVLLFSLVLACINNQVIEKFANKASKKITKFVDLFLKKFFIPLLPIFIFGFLIKLLHDDIIGDVLSVNPKAFFFMIVTLISYLVFILIMTKILYKKNIKKIMQNIMAPAVTAFTSMSSAAALPFSINAAESNTGNKSVADVVMPATANVHMIGDSICIPILSMILLTAFGHQMPTFSAYLIFAVTFVITKFSGAGVPGGSILVMLPVLESCLGFTSEMAALITICYMLLDPICSTGNVVGNNIFVIHFSKLYEFIIKLRKA